MRKTTKKILGVTCVSLLVLATTNTFADCGQGTAGGITNIPTLGGFNFDVLSLSQSGAIGGYSSIPGEQETHAFIYTNGVITDLGTFGGTYSQVNAVNSSNQAAGYATTSGDATSQAFLYSGGPLIGLGDLGGGASLAQAMNDSAQITGLSVTTAGLDHAFLWSNGNLTDLGDLGGGYSTGTAINGSGTIIGDSYSASFFNFAFVYSNGVMTSLGDLGSGTYSSSRAINDSGMIVGESADTNGNTHAFLYSNGAMTDLGTLGGTYSTAVAISSTGVIIGDSRTATGETHGFVSDGTNMVDLGTLGGNESEADSINRAGLIVGQARTPDFNFHAVMWTNGVITDLNSLISPDSGWFLESAQYVNDAGRIVGFGSLNNQFQWFVLDPSSGGGSNAAPIAVAGPDQTVQCQESAFLDGSASSDPSGGALTYSWAEGNVVLGTNSTLTVSLALGDHTLTLTVVDPCDASAQTNVTVHVVDTTAPTITGGPGPLTASADGNCEAPVPNVATQIVANDNCTPANALVITQNPVAGTMVGLGQHQIIVTVKDASGNSTAGSTYFTVVDTTAPVITSTPGPITVSAGDNGFGIVPNVLGGVVASDSCTPANALGMSQNPSAGTSLGLGGYSIMVTVKDAAGNASTATVALNVVDTTPPVITGTPALPMTVSAGANGLGVVPNVLGGIVATDNCTPANALVMSQSPVAGTSLRLGNYSIVVTVKDASGNASTTAVALNVVDTTPPVITSSPAPITVSAGANGRGVVPNVLGGIVATDNCTPANALVLGQSLTAGTQLGLGNYTIVVTVTDASGNSSTANVSLKVVDTTAPVINSLTASPNTISPPNHRMVPVTLSVSATDNCDPAPVSKIVSITCNESASAGEMQITGALTASVAATRDGGGSGRIYTITVQCTDASGNSSTKAVTVTVPH